MFRGICYLFRFIYQLQKKYIISLFLMEIGSVLLSVANVVLPKYVIDSVFQSERVISRIVVILAIYIGIVVLLNTLIGILKYQSEKERDELFAKYSILQGRHFLNIEHEKLESAEFLQLRDQSTKYMNAYGFAGIIPLTMTLIGKLITGLSLITILTVFDVRICLIFLLLASINLVITIKNKKTIVKEDLEMVAATRRRDYVGGLFENPSYAKEIRSYHLCDWLLEKYTNESSLVRKHQQIQNHFKEKNNIIHIVTDALQLGIVYLYLMNSARNEAMSIGNFTMYLASMVTFNRIVIDFASTIIDLNYYNTYFKPFQEFIEYLESIPEGTRTLKQKKDYTIEFRNVSFHYPGQAKNALSHVNLKLSSKEAICMVGENGAGKTTFIKLLLRFYHPTEGEILLDGINIWEYQYESYLESFSVLFQDFRLFAASLKENIILNTAYQDEDIRLKKALKDSGVKEFLEKKELDENVSVFKLFDEKGVEFSGGESQRIAFARALYRNAPILLLDEPSAALDPLSESELLNHFSEFAKDKLSIFISHRLTSAKICNRILVFHEGILVEDGSHETLMELEGRYAMLYHMQSELYK